MTAAAADVAVIGLGAHGSATLMHAARAGLDVIGIERCDIGHARGSSHGVHRLFRLAYAEGAHYVPLLLRARELWQALGREAGVEIFVENGVLIAAPEGDAGVAAARDTCSAHRLEHAWLDADEINRRYPAFRLPDGFAGLLQPQSGFVYCERAIAAHVALAMQAGARVHARTRVTAIEQRPGGVSIATDRGEVFAGAAVVAAGAWTGALVPELAALHTVGRRVMGFFAPRRPADFTPERCPGFSFKSPKVGIYGFPIAGFPGVKIGRDGHLGETGDPDALSREATARDEAALREGLAAFLADVDGPALALQGCVVTDTPDGHFIIDRHPAMDRVHVVSACSGHGFKMASAIGAALADRLCGRPDALDLSAFRLARFGA